VVVVGDRVDVPVHVVVQEHVMPIAVDGRVVAVAVTVAIEIDIRVLNHDGPLSLFRACRVPRMWSTAPAGWPRAANGRCPGWRCNPGFVPALTGTELNPSGDRRRSGLPVGRYATAVRIFCMFRSAGSSIEQRLTGRFDRLYSGLR